MDVTLNAGIQSRLPGSQPMDIHTSPELPQRDVLRQGPQSSHICFVSVLCFFLQFYLFFTVFFFTVFYCILQYILQYFIVFYSVFQRPEFIYLFIFYLFLFAADPKSPFLWAVGRKLSPSSPTSFLCSDTCQYQK